MFSLSDWFKEMRIVCQERQSPSPARFTNTVEILHFNHSCSGVDIQGVSGWCPFLPSYSISHVHMSLVSSYPPKPHHYSPIKRHNPQWLARGHRVPICYLLWRSFAAVLALVGLIQACPNFEMWWDVYMFICLVILCRASRKILLSFWRKKSTRTFTSESCCQLLKGGSW